MERAVVVLTDNEYNPFYGIVTYNDDEQGLEDAVRADFDENWAAPEGDSPDSWFESILGDYIHFFIHMDAANKLAEVEFPCYPNDRERALLDRLMISVCERFASRE